MRNTDIPPWFLVPNLQFQSNQPQYRQYYPIPMRFQGGQFRSQERLMNYQQLAQDGILRIQQKVPSNEIRNNPCKDQITPKIKKKSVPKVNAMHIKFSIPDKPPKDEFHPLHRVKLPLKYYDQSKAPLLTEQAEQYFQKAILQQRSGNMQQEEEQGKIQFGQVNQISLDKKQHIIGVSQRQEQFVQDKKVQVFQTKNKPISKEQIVQRRAMHTRAFSKKVARFQAKGMKDKVKIETEQKTHYQQAELKMGLVYDNYQRTQRQVKLQPGVQLHQNLPAYQMAKLQQGYQAQQHTNLPVFQQPFFSNFSNSNFFSYPFISFANRSGLSNFDRLTYDRKQ